MAPMLIRKTGILAVAAALAMLTGCSAMLIGEGSAESPPIGSDSRETAQMAADGALADAVTSAIAADSTLRATNLAVSARSGIVTLGGSVSSFEARDQAVRVAAGVSGVSRVNNQIRVNTKD
jgi:osmotically-inducible protein OsmY